MPLGLAGDKALEAQDADQRRRDAEAANTAAGAAERKKNVEAEIDRIRHTMQAAPVRGVYPGAPDGLTRGQAFAHRTQWGQRDRQRVEAERAAQARQAVKDQERVAHLTNRYWDFDPEKQAQYEIKKPDAMEQDRTDRIVRAW